MNYSVNIFIPEQVIQAISRSGDDMLLYQELKIQEDAVKSLLLDYHFSKRERVYGIEIKGRSLEINHDGQGSFRVNYMIGIFNACADTDYNQSVSMLCTIQINFQTGEAILSGEDIYEREPDEF